MKNFIFGFAVRVALVLALIVGYFSSGKAPVATDAPPMPMGKYLAKKALHATLDREMPKTASIKTDEASYLAGAKLYREHCAVCHGLLGQPTTVIARGMFPKPPALMQGKGVIDDEPDETYWKVVHGIRLTGMPGFRDSFSDTQSLQVSLLLANANKLPDSAKVLLSSPIPPTTLP